MRGNRLIEQWKIENLKQTFIKNVKSLKIIIKQTHCRYEMKALHLLSIETELAKL